MENQAMDDQTRQHLKAEVENLSKEVASIQHRLNNLLSLLDSDASTPDPEERERAALDILIAGESVKNYSYEEFFQNITSRIRSKAPETPQIVFKTNRVANGLEQGIAFTADKLSLCPHCGFNNICFNLRNNEGSTVGTVSVEFSTVRDEDGEVMLEGSTIKDVRVTLQEGAASCYRIELKELT